VTLKGLPTTGAAVNVGGSAGARLNGKVVAIEF
jgi:hypothetical protein